MDEIVTLDPLKIFNQIEEDCPKQLFALGNTSILDELNNFEKVAIIGARNADNEGLGVAYDLGKQLNNTIVISGLAKGIDTAAHVGCLYRRGLTIAVVGSGLNHVHPKENIPLQQRILANNGLILTEQSPKIKASPGTLIARTRLQVALADKVYVVECKKQSGTMHAINFALKYGKPIYALDCDWTGNRYLIDNGLAEPFEPLWKAEIKTFNQFMKNIQS